MSKEGKVPRRKITISPVTRIEGHARVTIHLDDSGRVERTFFHVDQYRGFEKFAEGRHFTEMPTITERICGICPVSHHLASAKAGDAILGVEITRTARLLRELMHMGQIIQSHSMHFFELAGPDLFLGFDADPALRNVVGLIQANPELALKAVKLRKYGQRIIELVGGRRIHPNFAVPGGVNRTLSGKARDEILSGLDEALAYAQEGIAIFKDWLARHRDLCDSFAPFETGYMGLVDDEGALALYDGLVRVVDGKGTIREEFPPSEYLDHVAEHVEDWSYLKFPYLRSLGWPAGVYRVGPLGRLNVADRISTPLAQAEFEEFRSLGNGGPVEGSIYYHYARLIEVVYALERTREILTDPEVTGDEIYLPGEVTNLEVVGALEAPRGTLYHHYRVDRTGTIRAVNLIVSTGHNNWAMSKAVEEVAKAFVDGSKLTEGMLNRVEGAIRCYDPCLSCSTHAIGKMPLLIELYGSEGELLDVLRRDG